MFKNAFLVYLLLISFAAQTSFAQEELIPSKNRLLLEFGQEWGGDELLTTQFTNGDEKTIYAGKGLHLMAGIELSFEKIENLKFRISTGLKWSLIEAENASIHCTRIPLTVSPFLLIKNDFRIGIGATTHLIPKLHGDAFIDNIKFTSKVGPRLEIGYRWFALTYTLINYELDNQNINASSFGVILSNIDKRSWIRGQQF